MLRITKHAIERYYERILEQPEPEQISISSEIAQKLEKEIISACMNHPLKLAGKLMVNVGDQYKAIINNGSIVTISHARKSTETKNSIAEKFSNKNKQFKKKAIYIKGKKRYGR